MARYADLVEEAILTLPQQNVTWIPKRINLSIAHRLPSWLPSAVITWLNHLWMALSVGPRSSRQAATLVHVLDGSFGYLVSRIPHDVAVATVHDLIPLIQREFFSKNESISWLAAALFKKTQVGLDSCAALIADSESTRTDLDRLMNVAREKVEVIQIALGPEFSCNQTISFDLGGSGATPYVLHVGNNAWYKNREGVVRIFSQFAQDCDVRLVLAGPPPSASLGRVIKYSGVAERVEVVTDPEDAALQRLYAKASVFLFPSLYEGYGWPPLEAMALGCPVVCSTAASLPEVVGDAALTAPPEDEDALANHCRAALTQPELGKRLSEQGRERAEQFTIERMGRELVAVYERALERSASSD